jgi:hypothetical protein
MATDLHHSTEPSTTSLVTGIIDDAQELLKQQLALFKAELKQDVNRAKEATPIIMGGYLLCLTGILLLGFMLVQLLRWIFPTAPDWVWFGTVGVLFAGVGGAMIVLQLKQMKPNPLPETTKALKENIEWKTNRQ